MSELAETAVSDAVTIARWHRCTGCDVTWKSTSTTCWSCESPAQVVPDTPPPTSDTFTSRHTNPTAATPLTPYGTRRAG